MRVQSSWFEVHLGLVVHGEFSFLLELGLVLLGE